MSPELDMAFAQHAAALKAIHEHCGYVEQWRVFPLVDERKMFWHIERVDQALRRVDGGTITWSPSRESLVQWVGGDESGGDDIYSGEIYTQRHHPKWVYRGPLVTLAIVDTRSDCNIFLMAFDTAREVPNGL